MNDDKIPICYRCKAKPFLRRIKMRDGEYHHLWHCENCNAPAVKGKPFISKKKIEEWKTNGRLPIDAVIPMAADYSTGNNCDVCGAEGAQLHHWLPQTFAALVDDHNQWPVSNLCKHCHRLWHNIVTPYLPGFGNTDEAQYTKNKYISEV